MIVRIPLPHRFASLAQDLGSKLWLTKITHHELRPRGLGHCGHVNEPTAGANCAQ